MPSLKGIEPSRKYNDLVLDLFDMFARNYPQQLCLFPPGIPVNSDVVPENWTVI